MTNNGSTAKWVAIVITTVIAMVSLSIGVIRTSNREALGELRNRVSKHDIAIHAIKEDNIEFKTEIKGRLKALEKNTDKIDQKVDILIKRGGNAQ